MQNYTHFVALNALVSGQVSMIIQVDFRATVTKKPLLPQSPILFIYIIKSISRLQEDRSDLLKKRRHDLAWRPGLY